VDLQAGEGQTLVLSKKTKSVQQPIKARKTTELKKRHSRQLAAIAKEAAHVRPDLKVCLPTVVRHVPQGHTRVLQQVHWGVFLALCGM
jgi:hypothetical protein